MENRKFKLVKKAISSTIALTSIIVCCSCTKEVDCTINGEHVHLYIDEDSKLSRYIESEKVNIGNLVRTESYLKMTDELDVIDNKELCLVEDNLEYLNKEINSYQSKRQAYVYDYIYGTYYGYGYGYDVTTGDYSYHYGLQTGYHYDYEWQDISLNEYTEDKVRDITYQFKFYKINADGSISSKLYNSLEERSEEYKYFKSNDLVKENISDEYYLQKEKQKTKMQ